MFSNVLRDSPGVPEFDIIVFYHVNHKPSSSNITPMGVWKGNMNKTD